MQPYEDSFLSLSCKREFSFLRKKGNNPEWFASFGAQPSATHWFQFLRIFCGNNMRYPRVLSVHSWLTDSCEFATYVKKNLREEVSDVFQRLCHFFGVQRLKAGVIPSVNCKRMSVQVILMPSAKLVSLPVTFACPAPRHGNERERWRDRQTAWARDSEREKEREMGFTELRCYTDVFMIWAFWGARFLGCRIQNEDLNKKCVTHALYTE